jgi:hypothetical protein
MELHFLNAPMPLTKVYEQLPDGTILKTPYPNAYEVTSMVEQVADLPQFEDALKRHAQQWHCLVKGKLSRQLVSESRAGTTDSTAATDWICLDIDGLPEIPAAKNANAQVDLVLDTLGLGDVSYILQWSASYGVENKAIRAHVFMLLAKPAAAPLIKQWLIHLNHMVGMLRSAMKLTKTGNAISWPLDVSACQNDKLIYIAPPTLKGGIKNLFPRGGRILRIDKDQAAVTLPTDFSTAKNRELTDIRIAELRAADGLPKRKNTYKMVGNTEVLAKPDSCTISEMKQERGFVYFNLNGGDSWAYYHPENNPDFIHNFKGEPAYLTKELLPEYWEQLTAQGSRADSQGRSFLAFCDRATSAYWRGTYDAPNDALELHTAKNETQIRHFAKQHGMPLGDYIPEWDLIFDPHDNVRVDHATKRVNRFTLSQYMRATARQVKAIPTTINRVIDHVLGHDPAVIEHFINWLAFILQERDRTLTAWVLHGVPGTGKGILIKHILQPIFGAPHVTMRRMEELNEPYNHFMEQALIVFVDEMQAKALHNEEGVMAKLRNFITESQITIRGMFRNAYDARNYTNWIFASNKPDPVAIPENDRRMNVAKYQPKRLDVTDKDLVKIEAELQAFHDYLLYYQVDKQAARTVLDTADRNTLISISASSVDTATSALLEGDFQFFVDQMPSSDAYKTNALEMNRVEDYRKVLTALLDRTNTATGACAITRDELRTMFDYAVGDMPKSPNKFTSLLKHHRLHMTNVRVANATPRGIYVEWQNRTSWAAYTRAISVAKPAVAPMKRVK